jgi:hypothetical protein
MTLVLCPSRTFAIYLLAYVAQFGKGRRFHFLIVGNNNLPDEFLSIGITLNVEFISENEIQSHHYDELITHSYFLFSAQNDFIAELNFKVLTYYSDGIRNGFYGLPRIDSRLKKLIYFGLKLRESSFELSIPNSMKNLEHEVVNLDQLSKIWKILREDHDLVIPSIFTSSDLLIVMRYWGMPGSHYEFRPNLSLLDYLRDELENIDGVNRVIYRADPRFNHGIAKLELEKMFANKVAIIMWEDLFGAHPDFCELLEPESVIYAVGNGPKYFVGFDSSLNVLVKNNWIDTEILWPNNSIFERYFEYPRSTAIVDEQLNWMKVVGDNVSGASVIEITVDGFLIEQAITRIVLDSHATESD